MGANEEEKTCEFFPIRVHSRHSWAVYPAPPGAQLEIIGKPSTSELPTIINLISFCVNESFPFEFWIATKVY